jgi:hypothetical protein
MANDELLDRLEPDLADLGVDERNPVNELVQVSQAISLKRIADFLEWYKEEVELARQVKEGVIDLAQARKVREARRTDGLGDDDG